MRTKSVSTEPVLPTVADSATISEVYELVGYKIRVLQDALDKLDKLQARLAIMAGTDVQYQYSFYNHVKVDTSLSLTIIV